MKQIVGDLYHSAFKPGLKDHLVNGMGFSEEDKRIILSLMDHDGDSNFHYDNTGLCKEKFERHLKNINRILIPELVRLANVNY